MNWMVIEAFLDRVNCIQKNDYPNNITFDDFKTVTICLCTVIKKQNEQIIRLEEAIDRVNDRINDHLFTGG